MRPKPSLNRRWDPNDRLARPKFIRQRNGQPRFAVLGSSARIGKFLADPCRASAHEPLTLPLANHATTRHALASLDEIEAAGTSQPVGQLFVLLPLPPNCDAQSIFVRIVGMGTPLTLVDMETPWTYSGTSGWGFGFHRIAKGFVDRVGALILLTLLMPILLVVGALIALTSPGPPIFVQPRLGRDSTVIHVFKFRTMYTERGDRLGGVRTVPDDPRVTPVGRILRRWSIDELPQLMNVLIGNMSLIGPRPHAVLMTAGEKLYFETVPGYLRRHIVKPGITGWAQINGMSGEVASAAAGGERLAFDLHYIANASTWFDLRILFKTVIVIFDRANRY